MRLEMHLGVHLSRQFAVHLGRGIGMRLGFAAVNGRRRLFGEALPHDRERAQHALAIEMRFARDRRAGRTAYKPLQ